MSKKSAIGSGKSAGNGGASPAAQAEIARGKNVVFYDGVCTFCDGTVQFLYGVDSRKNLAFATLQSEVGRALIAAQPNTLGDIDSIIFVREFGTKSQRIHVKSTAILRIVESLGGAWRFSALFRAVPPFIRNAVYDWFARHRYGWFGKKNIEACMIPPPEDRERFFD